MRNSKDHGLWTAQLLLLVSLLAVPAGEGYAFRVIGAPQTNGTYCLYPVLNCGSNDTFARWWTYNVPYWINEDAGSDAVNGTLTQAEIISATQAAYQEWEDAPNAIIKFTYAGETSARIGVDGVNSTVWYNAASDAGVCPEANLGAVGGTLGLAMVTIDAASGQITDTDLLMDSADSWEWNTSCILTDIQSVLTHEAGHGIGIQHPENADWGSDNVRPTMWGTYFCNPVIAAARTLEPDDETAAECLYPEVPTLILIDETGSMAMGNRMSDTKEAANDFVDEFADNLMAVAGFADPQKPCPGRVGYELLQDWTQNTTLLHQAINSTFACGATPLWEATCCGILKAMEEEPSNLLVFTDLDENTSDGDCGCSDFGDVLTTAENTDVVVYAIDMSQYFGLGPADVSSDRSDPPPAAAGDDGPALSILCQQTGGLYFRVFTPSQLFLARIAIQQHIVQFGKIRQSPPDCDPGTVPIDDIQVYVPETCVPNSPFEGAEVTVSGVVTVERGTLDGSTQYIEDCSGGLQIFGNVGPMGVEGDLVKVTGIIGSSSGEVRMATVLNYSIIGSESPPVPSLLPPGTGHFCEMIGSLMTVRGYVDAPVNNSRFPLVMDPDLPLSPALTVYIDPDTNIDPRDVEVGQLYHVTGVLTRSFQGNELKPRSKLDMDLMSPSDVGRGRESRFERTAGIRSIHPNPSGGGATIAYSVPSEGPVRLEIVDVRGRLVRRLVGGMQQRAVHTARWDGRNKPGAVAAAGVYFVRYTGPDGFVDTKRVLLLK